MATHGALAPPAPIRATRAARAARGRSPSRPGRPPPRVFVCRSAADAADTSTDPVDAQRPPLRVIIAGAGIGGLATCLALRRVGVDAHVYERAVCLKTDAGTGIALWPNGLKALRAIGADVERQVAERGADVKGVRFGVLRENVSSDTSAIPPREDDTRPPTNDATNASASISRYLKSLVSAAATRVVPKLLRARHGAGLLCIRWASAQDALASFLPKECLHLDATLRDISIVDFADGSKGVAVAFAKRDGSDVGEDGPILADVLIGADGVNSATRAALLRDGPPRDNGRVIWRGVVEARDATRAFFASEEKQQGDQTAGSTYPPFCPEKFTSLSASEDSAVGRTTCFMDVGGGKLYWAAGCLDASAVVAGDGSDDAANCAATFASNPEVLACLEATKKKGESETGGLYTSRVVDRAPLDAATFQAALRETVGDARSDFEKNETENDFSSAPVALLGDAAHPVIPSFGQGANLALEDAVELALALAHVDRRRAPRALREWERRRFERTKEAQIASFLSGSRSYGPEKLRLALEASGLSKEALRRHKETFPDANKTQDWLLAWKPSTEKTLPSVAPNRAMALARRAASAATPAGVGGVGDEFGDAGRDAGTKNVGAFLFFFSLQAALAALPATAAPVSVAEEALIDFARSERDATAEKKTQTRFVGDGFAFDLPSGWRATDLPGVSVSKTSLTYDGLPLATAPEVTVTNQNEFKNTGKFLVTREPTFTMGAAGLDSLYGSAEIFGARVAGARRGELSVARVSKSGDAFVAEGVEVGGDEDGKKTRWLELVACGCRGGPNARKYNLLQTISVTGETADDAEFEGLRAIADSFRLTAGKTCGANEDE